MSTVAHSQVIDPTRQSDANKSLSQEKTLLRIFVVVPSRDLLCCTSSLRIISYHSLFQASSTELKCPEGPRSDGSAGIERRDSCGAEGMGPLQGLFRTLLLTGTALVNGGVLERGGWMEGFDQVDDQGWMEGSR